MATSVLRTGITPREESKNILEYGKVFELLDRLLGWLVETLKYLFVSLVLFFWLMVIVVIMYHVIKTLSKFWS